MSTTLEEKLTKIRDSPKLQGQKQVISYFLDLRLVC
jgi:hypothetical protein